MGGRGEAHHQDGRPDVSERRYGFAPVVLVAERSALLACDALPPLDEAGATVARDDPSLEPFEVRGGQGRSCGSAWSWCAIVLSCYNTCDLGATLTLTPREMSARDLDMAAQWTAS